MDKKRTLIIGATSGIGRALAELLVSKGHIVGVTGRRQALLHELAASRPDRYRARAFDVTETTTSAGHLDALAKAMGGVDTVVISAGGGDVNEALDFEVEQKMIALNVHAFTQVADWAFNYFKQQGYGHLAAISSIAGIRGSRQAPAYSATKAYQINYLEGLRQKAHRERADVIVTDIRPGFVDTPAAKSPVRFWVAPISKTARQIYHGLCRRQGVIYVTRRWQLIAWLYRWLPAWLHERM